MRLLCRDPEARRGVIDLDELASLDVIHGPRRASPATHDRWLEILRATDPQFEFTDPPAPHSLPMALTFAATASWSTAVLTGPHTIAGPPPGVIRLPRPAGAGDMARVSIAGHPLTATAAASAAVSTGQGDWVQDLATRALASTADPELRLAARHNAAWALAWSGRRTAALSALLSVADEASGDLPALAWDALGSAATVAYQSGMPASRQAVSRALGLLERQGPPLPGRTPGIDVNVLRLWMRASADPIGSRNQLLPYLRKIVGSPIEEPSLWRVGSAAWLLDESDLAITLLQDAMQRLRAPGVRGTSGGSLTVLGWAYIDTGRWDEALDAAAEAADLAEANKMDIIAASADVITATVLALRGDSAAARTHADRALATVDAADSGLVAARARRVLGVAALADGSYLLAFTQLRGLFSEDGTPLHNYASYLGVADLAEAAVRADRRMEGRDVIERALSRHDATASARLGQLMARARGILADPSNSPSGD